MSSCSSGSSYGQGLDDEPFAIKPTWYRTENFQKRGGVNTLVGRINKSVSVEGFKRQYSSSNKNSKIKRY